MTLKTPVNFGKSAKIEGKDLYWITEFYYDETRKKWSTALTSQAHYHFTPSELDQHLRERIQRERSLDRSMGGLLPVNVTKRRLRVRKITVVEEGYVDI